MPNDNQLNYLPLFEALIDKFNALKLENVLKSNQTAKGHSDQVFKQAGDEVLNLTKLIEKLSAQHAKAEQFHEDTEPFLKEINEELAKLDELYRIRGLLIRINTIKEVHEKLDWHLEFKSSKQLDLDSKLLEAVDLFQKLIEMYEEMSKSSASSNNVMLEYLRNVLKYWHDKLRVRLETRFEAILGTTKWPLVGINALPGSSSTVQASVTFDTYFTALLRIEVRHLFEANADDNRIKVCLPVELMTKPIAKRFVYHFMKTSRTNQLEKPEWYLTQTLNWIKDNSEFLVQNVDPLLRLHGRKGWASAKIQFASVLIELIKSKLKTDLQELIFDDKLFSHTFDEVLSFARELETMLGGNKVLIKQNCDLFSLFSSEPNFTKLINLERTKSTEYIEVLLQSPSAWSPIIAPDNIEDDELKAPEAADNFVILLQSISDRSAFISDTETVQAFIKLQLEMLDDFRLRLTQLVRINPIEEEDIENVKRWPFSQRYFGILNTVNYLVKVLEEWCLTPAFIESSTIRTEALLDEAILLFKHMYRDMINRITRSLSNQIRVKAYPYSNVKWFCVQPMDESVKLASCELLYFIASALDLLKKSLAKSIFTSICVSIAGDINRIIIEEVILKNNFNEEGANVLQKDIKSRLCSIFDSHMRNSDSLFTEAIEATTLLCLQQGTAILLDEAQFTPDEDSVLGDLGVEVLEPELALRIARRRLYV